MKFGAIFEEYRGVERLKRMITIAERQARQLVIIRLTPGTVYVITSEGSDCKVRCEIPSNILFSRYIFEGIASDCNEACLQINGDYFARIFRSVTGTTLKKMRLKLVRGRQESYISVEIEIIEDNNDIVRVVNHNIPIIVISRKFWSEFISFTTPESDGVQYKYATGFQVSVYMPPIQMVRNVIDRMKHWDCYISLIVKNSGATCVKVKGPSTMVTNFKSCELNKDVIPSREESIVRLDVKRVSLYFNNLHVECHTQCFVTHERCVHFKSMFGETCFQIILPHFCE